MDRSLDILPGGLTTPLMRRLLGSPPRKRATANDAAELHYGDRIPGIDSFATLTGAPPDGEPRVTYYRPDARGRLVGSNGHVIPSPPRPAPVVQRAPAVQSPPRAVTPVAKRRREPRADGAACARLYGTPWQMARAYAQFLDVHVVSPAALQVAWQATGPKSAPHGVQGFIRGHNGGPERVQIFINGRLPAADQAWVLAHELGHLRLPEGSEADADTWADAFLAAGKR